MAELDPEFSKILGDYVTSKTILQDAVGGDFIHVTKLKDHFIKCNSKIDKLLSVKCEEKKRNLFHWLVHHRKLDILEWICGKGPRSISSSFASQGRPWPTIALTERKVSRKYFNVNAQDVYGFTPLHLATQEKHEEVVKALLAYDTWVDIDIAAENMFKLDKYKEKKQNGQTALHIAARDDNFSIMKMLLDFLKDRMQDRENEGQAEFRKALSIKSMSGKTVLHYAAQYGKWKVVRCLVEAMKLCGADDIFNNCDIYRQTPLYLAASHQNAEAMEVLLREGKNLKVNIVTWEGMTPLDKAKINIEKDRQKCFAKKIEADPQILNKLEEERKNKQRIVDMLESYDVNWLQAERDKYANAANCLLVGAALIASITYGGWLQPPLGLTQYYEFPISNVGAPPESFESYVGVQQHQTIQLFWIFNSLSFFCSIATFIIGADAGIPQRCTSMREEVIQLRQSVVQASFILSFAIMGVMGAFSVAGILVLPPIEKQRAPTYATMALGVIFCVILLMKFFKKLWMWFWSPRVQFKLGDNPPSEESYTSLDATSPEEVSINNGPFNAGLGPSNPNIGDNGQLPLQRSSIGSSTLRSTNSRSTKRRRKDFERKPKPTNLESSTLETSNYHGFDKPQGDDIYHRPTDEQDYYGSATSPIHKQEYYGLATSPRRGKKRPRVSVRHGYKLHVVSKGDIEMMDTNVELSPCESDIWDRVVKLRHVTTDYSYRYHMLNDPMISDSAYDALVRELKDLESKLPGEASKESLTTKVGAPPSLEIATVRHAVPMLSLAAVYKEEELRAWHERFQQQLNAELSNGGQSFSGAWVVEPQVDGLALTLRYERGRLVCAATRGDGSEGEDVTHHAGNLSGIPQVLPELHGTTNLHALEIEVRGEVYMTLNDFQELNEIKVQAGERPFANPRNAAAGSIRILKSRDVEHRRLSFIAYAVVSAKDPVAAGMEALPQLAKTQWDTLNLLKQMGFSVNDDNRKFDSFEDALIYATRWRDSRTSLKYESDGVIFKANDLAVQAKLGAVGSDPRWAVTWKFAATDVVTILESVELTIGRYGAIIPIARLKPVELGGVTISRASLHNLGRVEELGICEGDHVVVQRAGDVIPQIVQVLRALRPDHVQEWTLPEFCPSCNEELSVSKDKNVTSCCNNKCPGRHSRKIEHFAKTLFKGLGPDILSDIQDAGMVADPADFFDLDPAAFSRLTSLDEKSATQLVKAIEESKSKPLSELITALSIPRVRTKTAKLLEKWFGSMDRLLVASKEELQLVPGVGAVSAAAIQDWCLDPFNVQLVSRIKEAGFAPTFSDPEIEKLAPVSALSSSAVRKITPKSRTFESGKLLIKESDVVPESSSSPIGDVFESEERSEIVEEPPLRGKIVVSTGEL